MGDILIKILVCFLAGAGAGIGTGFAGMSAAAVIGPMLITFLGVPAYDAVGIGLISDVLASLVSAYTGVSSRTILTAAEKYKRQQRGCLQSDLLHFLC